MAAQFDYHARFMNVYHYVFDLDVGLVEGLKSLKYSMLRELHSLGKGMNSNHLNTNHLAM